MALGRCPSCTRPLPLVRWARNPAPLSVVQLTHGQAQVLQTNLQTNLQLDRNRLQHLVSALLVFGGLYVGWQYYQAHFVTPWHAAGDRAGKEAAESHYSQEVQRAAAKYDLDYSYLMSLLMLECSGKKPAGARFEPHVFNRLKQVRDGKRSRYENVTAAHLADASDDALRNLATSRALSTHGLQVHPARRQHP